MLEIKATRFFTCEGVSLAYALSVNMKDGANGGEWIAKFKAIPAADLELPPMGDNPWREMTDEEAAEYQKDQAEEERQVRSVRDSFDDEDEF